MRFAKLEAGGNDFIIIEDIPKNPSRAARLLCDRHYGVGADGVVLILPPTRKDADIRMRIFNADGSEAEMCGNAIRCFGKYLYDRDRLKKKKLNVETKKGIVPLDLMVREGKVYRAKVDLGEPVFERAKIPMQYAPGEEDQKVINEKLYVGDEIFEYTAVSMGNPHVVIWVKNLEEFPVEEYGPRIENYSLFPNRTNVMFVELTKDESIKQRSWERGVGETLSCGTGAGASVVVGVLLGKVPRKTRVETKGGMLEVYWSEKDGHVYLTGPCKDVFEGVIDLA